MNRTPAVRAHILLLAVAFIWGATFVVVKDALVDVSPLLFNLIRMSIAFVCMLGIYRGRIGKLDRPAILGGAMAGLFLATGYQFQTAGLARTTPSKSAFITGLTVVIVPLLCAVPWLRPRELKAPGWNAFLGAILAFTGIVLLTTPGPLSRMALGSINAGDLLTLGCAVGFSFHVLALAHTLDRVSFVQLAVLQIGFCALFMAISSPFMEHVYLHLTWRLAGALLIAAVLATAVAFSVQTWAQQYLPPTHIALIFTMEPVFAWLTSLVVLHAGLGRRGAAGALLILLGIGVTELLPSRLQPTAHEGVSVE